MEGERKIIKSTTPPPPPPREETDPHIGPQEVANNLSREGTI